MARQLVIKIGSQPLSRWAAAPQAQCRIIGTVTQGMEFGMLGIDVEGRYLRVNGSESRVLNKAKVEVALRSAARAQRFNLRELLSVSAPALKPAMPETVSDDAWQYPRAPLEAAPAPPPVVIVRKKRRVPVMVPA